MAASKPQAAFSIVFLLALTAFAAVARADKWGPPRSLSVTSSNAAFTFSAEPNPNWVDHVGSAAGELRRADGSLVWRAPIRNEVAPVSALVSDDGRFVATFDNWHSKGYGDNAIVVYGRTGEVLHSFSLADILSPAERVRLPASVSSIHWGGTHQIAGETLTLSVQVIPWEIFEASNYEAYRAWERSPSRFSYVRIHLVRGDRLESPQPHAVDVTPEHSCPSHLEVRAYPGPARRYDLAMVCVNRSGSQPVREGPAVHWRATREGWRIAERGQYLDGRRSGKWSRWPRGSSTPCFTEYAHGEIDSSTCP